MKKIVIALCFALPMPTFARVSVVPEGDALIVSMNGKLHRLSLPTDLDANSEYVMTVPLSDVFPDPITSSATASTSDAAAPGEPPTIRFRRHLVKAKDFFKKKNYDRALLELEYAEALRPRYARVKTMKGSIYYALGQKQLASKEWVESLKIDPSQERVRTYLDRLKSQ